ncbi:uncharacterized protein PHALS_15000 [Plasmopara halstedii]|uniref:Uncharacterized protein n=1 Tax=Plasmopara halstedii TaxID=4781 RepID=A0A0P1AZT2_PLAHL|nr:uncharacterized protein PHALS_15000 [Plasmopara halstedii]CEG47397.1 hypothetical protein PHALS_15000 [Plasmopara halstedii]|eukprot:XP_024583766.1 hypothetical protein PHALS_15000 [Plasmopara halstedii]
MANGLVAFDMMPIDAYEAIKVLIYDTYAQTTSLDDGITRLTARMGLARRFDNVGTILGPWRVQRSRTHRTSI